MEAMNNEPESTTRLPRTAPTPDEFARRITEQLVAITVEAIDYAVRPAFESPELSERIAAVLETKAEHLREYWR